MGYKNEVMKDGSSEENFYLDITIGLALLYCRVADSRKEFEDLMEHDTIILSKMHIQKMQPGEVILDSSL